MSVFRKVYRHFVRLDDDGSYVPRDTISYNTELITEVHPRTELGIGTLVTADIERLFGEKTKDLNTLSNS